MSGRPIKRTLRDGLRSRGGRPRHAHLARVVADRATA